MAETSFRIGLAHYHPTDTKQLLELFERLQFKLTPINLRKAGA